MKWVFIDTSWLIHRVNYTMQGLSHHDKPTGAILGFFNQLLMLATHPKIRSNRMVLFFDSRRSFRAEAFPEYKRKRRQDRSPEDIAQLKLMYSQLRRLRKDILPCIGFPMYRQAGLESDDLIASACEGLRGEAAVIITADMDLYQCLGPRVDWYDPQRQAYITVEKLWQQKRVTPADWANVKAIAGCKSDNVPGVPGVGEKTATDHLWKMVKPGSARHLAITSRDGRKIIRRNRRLVVLPHKLTKPVVLASPTYDAEEFFRWMKKLGIRSFAEGGRRKLWEGFFSGRMLEHRVEAHARRSR